MKLFSLLLTVAWRSIIRRRTATWLAVAAIAISTAVLLSVEFARQQIEANFKRTVSGIDLIIGPRTSSLHLLLYSVFHIGNPSNNISAEGYEYIDMHPSVAWTIPISLGDAFRGHAVIGTTNSLFEHFKYAGGRQLLFAEGEAFSNEKQAVVGSSLGYLGTGYQLVLAHGTGEISFMEHTEAPAEVVGILAPTGTPLDRSVMVPLELLARIHHDPAPIHHRDEDEDEHGDEHDHEAHEHRDEHDHEAHEHHDEHREDWQEHSDHDAAAYHDVTALFVGMKSPSLALRQVREFNNYAEEALTAILPGFAVTELWQLTRGFETTLQAVSLLVLVAAMTGMTAILLTTLNGRRYELAVLRAIGAPSWFVLIQLQLEATFISGLGISIALAIVQTFLTFGEGWLVAATGISVGGSVLTLQTALLCAGILALANLAASLPSIAAYRRSLGVGLHQA